MATIDSTRPGEPGNPLPIIFEVLYVSGALRVTADHDAGLLRISLAAEPGCRVTIAPEVALELSLHLVSRVNDLRHAGRKPRS